MSAMLDVARDVRARPIGASWGYGFMWSGTQKWGGLRWLGHIPDTGHGKSASVSAVFRTPPAVAVS